MFDYGSGKKASPGLGGEVPLGAVVGQEEMKEALLAVAANDALDGALLRGEKGTAKSTAVRALADLLPPQLTVADCPYGCPPDDPARQCADCRRRDDPPVSERSVPLVTLPLGATRERVVGSLSVADALSGDPEFEPGLLARANRGILYVDEVNLLDDHVVDTLLDAAASGVNRVERDGVSVVHPAEFTLVGTMNPEEGDLRPQLRDRFALQATVTGCEDLDRRATVVERALARDAGDSPTGAHEAPGDDEATERYRDRLANARALVDDVELPDAFLDSIVELCRDAGVDGHRADIATARAAITLAALDGRPKVVESDVRRAAELTLPHRLRSAPFEDAPDPEDVIDEQFDDEEGEGDDGGTDDGATDRGEEAAAGEADDGGGDAEAGADEADTADDGDDPGPDETVGACGECDSTADADRSAPSSGEADRGGDETAGASAGSDDPRGSGDADDERGGEADRESEGTPVIPGQKRAGVGDAAAPELDAKRARRSGGEGRAAAVPAVGNEGARVRTERADRGDAVDAAASVRAAGARGARRVESRDLRRSVREGDASTLVVFAVDASASMRGPLRAAKGVALELLRDAYERRDEVALVTFAGDDAQVVLPPTDSVGRAARHLKELPSGDRTPLAAGLETAAEVLARADPDAGVVVLVTDGRANAAAGSPAAETRAAAERLAALDARTIVVDAGDGERVTLVDEIATVTDGERVPLSALSADRVEATVERARDD